MDNYKNREFIDPSRGYLYIALAEHEVKENMLGHEKWIAIPNGADCLMHWRSGEKVFYRDNHSERWNCAYRGWYTVMGDDGFKQMGTLWERPTQDPALISGAEAKLAWANGEALQINKKDTHFGFIDMSNDYSLGVFDNEDYEFRLKPQTIKLELELPKPFEPKDGEVYHYIQLTNDTGVDCKHYCDDKYDRNHLRMGVWRTEADAKQALEVLKSLRGAS
ncbi:hypothetical protein [Acinetobacter baumannii]|uniref:hypothetical protein n=1 Tax=Acinetobacter baumannii TaxID=470 RepID=UPI000DE63530|nr:hypothetical protein [Acinetobacter baumannii]MCJ9074317.1 hypothetical protein [Acinetobacter baumannii]MCJ9147509.1 hypothetical protein [Acinetobacter baumannii]MCJ9563812.1 hypothetical protein [Acinetobacter baumannii]SSU79521.1 Uncharacterised protein [Acinetobacter baumannii]